MQRMQRMNPGWIFASAGGVAAATSPEQSPDIALQSQELLGNAFARCEYNSDGNKDGPLRPDKLFDALFAEEVFPHLCRAFEECDIDVPSSQAQEAVDSVSKIAVTDDGFKKMIECYKVKNRERLNQGRENSRQSSKKDKLETDKKFWEYRKDVADTVKSVAQSGNEATHDESSLDDSSAFASGFWKSSFGQYLSLASANDHYGNKSCWDIVASSVAYPMSSPDPFFSFCFWLLNHSLIPHKNADTKPQHKCRGEEIVDSFSKEPENPKNFAGMVALIRFCHMLRFWHRSSFASKTQCIFELCYCSATCSMFNLCFDKGAARSLRECMKLIELDYLQIEARKPSSSTSRWILLHAGRSLKQWGHRSLNEFEQCEVEKESNRCEKWRHLMFSYAVMALLYSEFNGNKQGPLGKYYFRDQCKIGEVGGCQGESEKYVYASKKVKDGTGECSDYLGHNIVALAVCKRGSILRVSYNHNVLFSSTVDHAEERLIDGLFKDPSAFIARSHAKIFRDGQRVNIEDHMKHISVYTSLEPCQQCSGKLHIAEVPELVFCQRDWDIQLLQAQLYEKFRKCRSIPASNFDFSPYHELSSGYYRFQNDRRKTFFSLEGRDVGTKSTMPYFLCSDFAQDVFRLGSEVFLDDFHVLFSGGDDWALNKTLLKSFTQERGLFKYDEWSQKAADIRQYRPLLDRKQKRVLYDELCSSRIEYIDLCHKRRCSVTIQFDPNSNVGTTPCFRTVNEHEIERHFAALADIKSIYLPRDLDGSLKGTATLVCSSPTVAEQLLALFKKRQRNTQQGPNVKAKEKQVSKGSDVIPQMQKEFLEEAESWLFKHRRIQDEEFMVPFDKSLSAMHILVRWHFQKQKQKEVIQQKQQEYDVIASHLANEKGKRTTEQLAERVETKKADDELLPGDWEAFHFAIVQLRAGANGTTGTSADTSASAILKHDQDWGLRTIRAFELWADADDKSCKAWHVIKDKASESDALEKLAAALKSAKEFEEKMRKDPKIVADSQQNDNFDVKRWVDAEIRARSKWKDVFHVCKWWQRSSQWLLASIKDKNKLEALENELMKLKKDAVHLDRACEQQLNRIQDYHPTRDEINRQTFPQSLLRHGQSVFYFRASNAAQARRFRLKLPNFEIPNQTVLWSPARALDVFNKTANCGSTISLVVRDDVSDASVLQFMQDILKRDIPSIHSSYEHPLKACDSNDIQWMDFSGTTVEFHSWKLRSFQFRSHIPQEEILKCRAEYDKFCNAVNDDDQWEQKCFRQPYSQPVLDLIFLKDDLLHYRNLEWDPKKTLLKTLAFKMQFRKPVALFLTVVSPDASKNTYVQATVDENGDAQVIRLDREALQKGMKKHLKDGCSIEMDHSCFAFFLFSDALVCTSLKNNFKSFLMNKYGKNVWGKEKSINFNVNVPQSASADYWDACTNGADFFWNLLQLWSETGCVSVCERAASLAGQGDSVVTKTLGISASMPKEHISCYYCCCDFVVPAFFREALDTGGGKFCCISHAAGKEKRRTPQVPIFSLSKPEKVTAKQSQDAARDKNLSKLFQRICELERLLLLNITVGSQHKLYFSTANGKSSQLRMQFQIRREEHDGDAHLSFFIEGPPDLLCEENTDTEIGRKDGKKSSNRNWSLNKNIQVSVHFCCQTTDYAVFSTALSSFPEFRELEIPLHSDHKLKTYLSGIYGRIGNDVKQLAISTENEGYRIPSECMRRLLEPEYYSDHKASYPFIKFHVEIMQKKTQLEDASNHDGAAGPSNFAFVATCSSHCVEELWLSDKDVAPDDKKHIASLRALTVFKDMLHSESELKNAVFSKTEVQKSGSHDNIYDQEKSDKEEKYGNAIKELMGSDANDTRGALVECKLVHKNLVDLKLLEVFKYFLNSENLIHEIRLRHLQWLREVGEELERQCEFSSALKYYYAGLVYYARRDEFTIGVQSTVTADRFDPEQLYETICEALHRIANTPNYHDWADRHMGVVLNPEIFKLNQRIQHLKDCLNLKPAESNPTLQDILSQVTRKLGVFFFFSPFKGALRPSEPCVELCYNERDHTIGLVPCPIIPHPSEVEEDLRSKFEEHFNYLLPYSNKQAYEEALESVRYQKAVLKRGTMSK